MNANAPTVPLDSAGPASAVPTPSARPTASPLAASRQPRRPSVPPIIVPPPRGSTIVAAPCRPVYGGPHRGPGERSPGPRHAPSPRLPRGRDGSAREVAPRGGAVQRGVVDG